MDVRTITTREALESSAEEWKALWQSRPGTTPFQSPDWLLPWWKHFGSGELFVIATREGGRLTGFVPLHILRDEESDESLGLFLGTGISDYLDPILDSAADAAATIEAIACAPCSAWELQQQRPNSLLLTQPDPEGWSSSSEQDDPCLLLSLRGADPGLHNLISTHFAKKLRYYRRLAARHGELRFESVTGETLDELLDAFFALHAARWSSKGLPGVLADDVVQQFHRDAAPRLLRSGTLRMYAMRIDAAVMAVFYGFAHDGTWYYYLSGYDPAIEKLSPGTLIVAHAIEEAIREGAHTFDFLRGAEDYKYVWGAQARFNVRRQLIRG